MVASPQNQDYTEAEYLALERESDIRHEFVDGMILAMSGGKLAHVRLVSRLHGLLFNTLIDRPCEAFTESMCVKREATQNYFYPDVTVVCGEQEYTEDESSATLLNPICLIEVLSESTELYDRSTKLEEYQQIQSLKHYVLVSQKKARIEIYTRGDDKNWIFTQADGLDASISLAALDVRLNLADIYKNVTFKDEESGE